MSSNRFLCSLAVFVVLATTCRAQPVKDPADLFPPDSLLYFEMVKPAEISREVMSMIKGTVLDDLVAYMAKWNEKDSNRFSFGRQQVGMMGIFASPELLAEGARLQGAAVAITGVNNKKEPEIVYVVLPGQSNFPNFVLRTILLEMDTRIAGQVEGVTVFGNRPMMFNRVAAPVANPPIPGAPPPPPPPLEPPFIASMPGAIIFGGSIESVGDVVKRIKSKEKRPALSDDADFKETSSLRRKAGLFTYANPGRVLDAIAKTNPKTLQEEEARAIVEMLNPKAIRSLASNLSLAEGAIQFQIGARLEPGKSSPVLDLIADQRVSLPLFQPVPKDSIVAFSLALTDGEKHWNRLLTAMDAAVGGEGPKPSKQIAEIEGKLKISIAKEIAGRIAAVTVAMPAKQELPKGASEIPMLFITGNDPGATEQLERLLPQVLSIFSGEPIDPVTQTIDGIKIRSATGANFPWKAPLHYGRSSTTLAIGIDRKLVASSLSGKIASSAISETKLVEVIKEHDRAGAVGMWRWAGLLPEAIAQMTNQTQWGPNGQPLAPDPAAQREKAEKLRKSMEGLIRDMPPLVVSIGRDDRQVLLRVQQRQSPGAIPKLIEDLFDGIMRGATNMFNAVPAPAAPAPVKN